MILESLQLCLCFNRAQSRSAWIAWRRTMGCPSLGAPVWRRCPKAATCVISAMQVKSQASSSIWESATAITARCWELWSSCRLFCGGQLAGKRRLAAPVMSANIQQHDACISRADRLSSPGCRWPCVETSSAASQRESHTTKLMSRRPGTPAKPGPIVSHLLRLGRRDSPAKQCCRPARRLAANTFCAASHRQLCPSQEKENKQDTC